MIEIDESYFIEEVKEGFLVKSMMKRAWAAELEVLEVIRKICAKNDIQYFADWGTLLGAVRHKGFIPWDDDIDIAMKRKDYNTFLKIAKKELPEGFCLLNVYENEEYRQTFIRVTNGNQINFTEKHLKDYHGFPYVAGVDIFPIDNLPMDVDEAQTVMSLIKLILSVENMVGSSAIEKEDIDKFLVQIEELCGVHFDKEKRITNQLIKLADQLSSMYVGCTVYEVTEFSWLINHPDYKLAKECYEELIWVPFEMVQIPIPKRYDEILTAMFGDYMVPVQSTSEHDYPFYEEQEKMLR